MTRPPPAGSATDFAVAADRRQSATGTVVGWALAVCGGGLVLSGLVDIVERADDTVTLLVLGTVVLAVGVMLRRAVSMPDRVPPRAALRSVIVAAVAMISVSAVAYLVTDTIQGIDDALFESTAGFSTTALTAIADVEAVDPGMLFWRALTQWLGGFFALATIVAVLPFLGVGGPQPSGVAAPVGAKHLLSSHVRRLLTGYFHLYLGLTSVGFVMFLAGGMGPFDAITYSFTTISTGGFANHDQSFAHFQSATIEWLGVGGMLLGGLSLPLAWRALRGRGRSSIRSTELIVYVGLVAGTTTVLALTTDAGGWHDTIRASAFTAASAVSTTGHWVTDWTGWAPGPQMLLLVLIGVGSMSGSLGGGFRIVRAMALVSYVRRELLRQLLPRSIHPVRVGRQVIDEETTDRMVGYQVLFIGTAAVGFFAIALAGTDLVTALSASVSALATFGPALGALAPGTPLTEASDWILLVLMGLMFAGRVELYPVLNAVVSVVTAPRRLLRGREQSRQRRRLRDSGPRRGGDAGARR